MTIFIYQCMIHYVVLPASFSSRKKGKNKSPNDTLFLHMCSRNVSLIHHFVIHWHRKNETIISQGYLFHLSLSDTLCVLHTVIFKIGKGKNKSPNDTLFFQERPRNGSLIHHFVTCWHHAKDSMTYHGRLFSSVTKWYIVHLPSRHFPDWEKGIMNQRLIWYSCKGV